MSDPMHDTELNIGGPDPAKKQQTNVVARHAIRLKSGYYFDFIKPDSSHFTIVDIAHALSKVCRFTGHCHEFYSVAQHSVLVSECVPEKHALAGLLHDAAEAFLGDVSKPLKTMLPDYCKIEERVERVVFGKFGLYYPLPKCVKAADLRLLRTEQRDLMGADGEVWGPTAGVSPLPERIVPVDCDAAQYMFLKRFFSLVGEKA